LKSNYELLTTQAGLNRFCEHLAAARWIAFDTEFVSEHTYRPVLCLVQVAAEGCLAAIDSLAVEDLTPFWRSLVEGEKEIIVHAGREEMGFCLEAVGRQPAQLFDVQIAAGLIGLEYPAGYGNLLGRLLGRSAFKGETRTDWRRRPLSQRQIDYALDDVRHLRAMRDQLAVRLDQLGRRHWLGEEMASWQSDVGQSFTRERWRKVTGSSSLSGRSLAVVRELWRWRDAEAQRRDCPPRKVLRDDLIVELAKRRSADPHQIRAVRGFERRDLRGIVTELAEAVARALDLPDQECPAVVRQDSNPQLMMLGQFLTSALGSICRAAEVAPSLVGTPNDVRELVAWRLGQVSEAAEPPLLTLGWRAEVVGHVIEELLAGKLAIRIHDPHSEKPLAFEPVAKP
jgi:ribonuclease D